MFHFLPFNFLQSRDDSTLDDSRETFGEMPRRQDGLCLCRLLIFTALTAQCVRIEMLGATWGQLLLPVSVWPLLCSGMNMLVYCLGGPFIDIPSPGGGWNVASQSKVRSGKMWLRTFLNNGIHSCRCHRVSRPNMANFGILKNSPVVAEENRSALECIYAFSIM